MKRLIVISFLFMGFAFYELSGGANFEPRGLRPAKPEQTAARVTPRAKPASEGRVAAVTLVQTQPVLATRTSRTSGATPAGNAQTEVQIAETDKTQAKDQLERVRVTLGQNLGQNLSLFPQTNGGNGQITLVSLDQGAAGLRAAAPGEETDTPAPPTGDPAAQQAAFPEPEPDLREISGTRVNMRDGPGTIFPVIARMTIGQKVEVLSESGTGWLRLRSVQGQQVGWISASLVSKDAR